MTQRDPIELINTGNGLLDELLRRKRGIEDHTIHLRVNCNTVQGVQDKIDQNQSLLNAVNTEIDREIARQDHTAQAERDHEREMAIIANETARENRLAAEAAAKVATTAQEQASQSVDSLLKGLQGDGKT